MQIKFGSILALLAPVTASQFTLADEYADARKIFQNAGESGVFLATAIATHCFRASVRAA